MLKGAIAIQIVQWHPTLSTKTSDVQSWVENYFCADTYCTQKETRQVSVYISICSGLEDATELQSWIFFWVIVIRRFLLLSNRWTDFLDWMGKDCKRESTAQRRNALWQSIHINLQSRQMNRLHFHRHNNNYHWGTWTFRHLPLFLFSYDVTLGLKRFVFIMVLLDTVQSHIVTKKTEAENQSHPVWAIIELVWYDPRENDDNCKVLGGATVCCWKWHGAYHCEKRQIEWNYIVRKTSFKIIRKFIAVYDYLCG